MKILLTLFVLFFSFSLIAKEEILYCTETDSAGFQPNNNYSKMTDFTQDRYTIKIDFQNKSLELEGVTFWNCDIPPPEAQMYCTLDGYGFFIDRKSYKFTYAKGYGYVATNKDSISISYGTCEKF